MELNSCRQYFCWAGKIPALVYWLSPTQWPFVLHSRNFSLWSVESCEPTGVFLRAVSISEGSVRGTYERQVPIYYTAASPWESEMSPAFGKYLGDPETGGERVAENLFNINSPVFCPLFCIPLSLGFGHKLFRSRNLQWHKTMITV